MNPIEILNHYWGHKAFRPLQESIIQSVIDQKDTIAILPTGGGKSICFQIPGLYFEGITLVISPLIALMNDQVLNLKNKQISAIAFHSGLSHREIEIEYSNIKNGKYTFVYVSPERIHTERFKEVISETNVKLLAIDEAHCISQWGHDFRPEYLLITELRDILINVPCIALTASATPHVLTDIKKYLLFKEGLAPFKQTIVRQNLSYVVLNDENKTGRLLKIVSNLTGTGLIYVRNRKTTMQLVELLTKNGQVADYYHAGLDLEERHKRQEAWQKGFTRIIVCTNAFGMGIDKSNVRFVVHYEIPDSLESYYQEAGRAGRDGNPSWCVLLYSEADAINAKKNLAAKYLDHKSVQTFYKALCNHFQISFQSGFEQSFELDVIQLAKKYAFSLPYVHTALDILQKEGVLKLSEAYANPSKINILTNNLDLYKFYLAHPHFELLIKTILRMYGGVFDNYIPISESEIAKTIKIPFDKVKQGLTALHQLKIMDYMPQNVQPQVTFLISRPESVPFNASLWKNLKEKAIERLSSLLNYVSSISCRQQALAHYFGEENIPTCGKCDVCRAKQKQLDELVKKIRNVLKTHFSENFSSFEAIIDKIGKSDLNLEAFRFILDNGYLLKNEDGLYKWKP